MNFFVVGFGVLGLGLVFVFIGLSRVYFLVKDSGVSRDIDRLDGQMRAEMGRFRQEFSELLKQQREELSQHVHQFSMQIGKLTESNEGRLDKMRDTLEKKIQLLQEDNHKKLEQMRVTVDEKLQSTLEKRLGESFKLVGDRLELVHKGLGEMQTLASGVGDLKRVLTNVKTRGIWGEVQLGNLLEQVLSTDQYAHNVRTKPHGRETVEFAIRLPGKSDHGNDIVWLPIDAKCPQDPYQRLLVAQEAANPELVELESKQLEMMVKREAKSIKEKYIEAPFTTDFAIMFIPIEGMYAEILRRPGVMDTLQNEYKVLIAGPMTLSALLNSLQMGFKTLAIQKRSSEVWEVLGRVKTEFSKFGDLVEKTKKKLQEASGNLELVSSKSRTIDRQLNKVEILSLSGAEKEIAISLFSEESEL
jgi:DNA recombination protein RmuC